MTEKNDHEQKYIFYLNDSKTIVLTDEDPDFDPRQTYLRISKTLASNKLALFETTRDFLVVKPKDVKAIQVSLNKNISDYGDGTPYVSPKKVAKEIIDETSPEDYIDSGDYDINDIPEFPMDDEYEDEEDEIEDESDYEQEYENEFKNLTNSADKYINENTNNQPEPEINTEAPVEEKPKPNVKENSDIIYEEGMDEVKFKQTPEKLPVNQKHQALDGNYKDLDSEGMTEVDEDMEYFTSMKKKGK